MGIVGSATKRFTSQRGRREEEQAAVSKKDMIQQDERFLPG